MAYMLDTSAVRRRGLGDSMSMDCLPDNGNYSATGPGHYRSGPPAYGGPCTYFAPPSSSAPSAPANVTVQTTVSPQISPNFQQQFQPSNSPMSAGTSQTSPSAGGQVGASPADVSSLLAQEAAAQQAAQQSQMDTFMRMLAAQQAAQQAASIAAQQAPAAAAVQPIPVSSADTVSGSLDTIPQMSNAPASATTAPAPIISTPTGYSNTMLMLVALGTLAAFMALQPKGQRHHGLSRR